MPKSARRFPKIPFYRLFKNKTEPGTSFQATFFVEVFDKSHSIVVLHKLVRFRY